MGKDYNEFFKHCIIKFIKMTIDKNKEIIYKGNKIYCNADNFLIKRVINNLISNAIFYGKSSKYIYIDLNKTKSNIEISITDEGDGIRDDIDLIFKKYYSASKKYSNIGIGLGLYIANKIIAAHNGTINAKNTQDKGACFTINLPAWFFKIVIKYLYSNTKPIYQL